MIITNSKKVETMQPKQPNRRYPRNRVDIRVKLFINHLGTSQSIIVRTYELGPGGLSVYAPHEIPVKSEIVLDFTIPGDKESIRVGAVVRNRSGFRYGMEFQAMASAQRDRLRVFCAQLGVPAKTD